MTQQLVLASTSPFRQELLKRLEIPFETAAPKVDETRLSGESPTDLVWRLSETKARAVAADYPDALIIGSDQVAVIDNQILGKPGNHEQAVEQLAMASGKQVKFLTGLCLHNARSGNTQTDIVPFTVIFRNLTNP